MNEPARWVVLAVNPGSAAAPAAEGQVVRHKQSRSRESLVSTNIRIRASRASLVASWSLVLVGLLLPARASAQRTKEIAVIGHDYAFRAPDTVEAGATLFSLQNKGTVRHEVVIVLLKAGHTLAEFLQAKTPEERRTLNDGTIGLILALPGQAAPGSILTDLRPGRSYVLICNLRDTPEKPPHAQLGMAALLHVK